MNIKSGEDVGQKQLLWKHSFNKREKAVKNSSRWYRKAVTGLALMAGLVFVSTPVLAQFLAGGTATTGGISANTDITNSATLNYSISGTTQPLITSPSTTFKVDNLVRVTVAEVGSSFTAVAPNATAQVTTFTVTNTGNTPMDYALTPNGAIASGQSVTLGVLLTDSNITAGFDATACVARVENGVTPGSYQSGQDTAAAVLQLSPIAGSNTVTVYVVCNIPSAVTATNGNNALVSLTATTSNNGTCAANGTGCVTTTLPTSAGLNVVFADAAGSDDAARDGAHSARDVYQVAAAVISVSKTVTVICDPFNGATSPRNIPGAFVRYEITISNAAGAASATLTDISDALNANTSFDPDQRLGTGGTVGANLCTTSTVASAVGSGFRLSCTSGAATPRACVATPVFYTSANDGDAMFFNAGTVTARFGTGGGSVTGVQALPAEAVGLGYAAGELKGGESVTIRFNAIIN